MNTRNKNTEAIFTKQTIPSTCVHCSISKRFRAEFWYSCRNSPLLLSFTLKILQYSAESPHRKRRRKKGHRERHVEWENVKAKAVEQKY